MSPIYTTYTFNLDPQLVACSYDTNLDPQLVACGYDTNLDPQLVACSYYTNLDPRLVESRSTISGMHSQHSPSSWRMYIQNSQLANHF